MGRGIIESGLFRSQKCGVSELTSDPADHQEGERWIRTDLAPETDQIATYRFDMGADGVVDIPIYDAGATVDGVEKVRRVQVNGQTGFIRSLLPERRILSGRSNTTALGSGRMTPSKPLQYPTADSRTTGPPTKGVGPPLQTQTVREI